MPQLVEKSGARRRQDRPGKRADQRRHVIGELHQALEPGGAGQICARQCPGGEKSDDDRQHRCDAGDKRRVGDDPPAVEQVFIVLGAVSLGRKNQRVAGIHRQEPEVDHRIEHQGATKHQDQPGDDRLGRRQPVPALAVGGRRFCTDIHYLFAVRRARIARTRSWLIATRNRFWDRLVPPVSGRRFPGCGADRTPNALRRPAARRNPSASRTAALWRNKQRPPARAPDVHREQHMVAAVRLAFGYAAFGGRSRSRRRR